MTYETVIRRPIPGFPDYFADTTGDIWSKKRQKHTRLTPEFNKDGYYKLTLFKNGKRHKPTVHSLIALSFLGKRPKHHDIDHVDWNRTNNALSNLRYLHKSRNASLLSPAGKASHTAAVTKHCDLIALQAIRDRRSGLTQQATGLLHGMSQPQVGRLCRGECRPELLQIILGEEAELNQAAAE